MEKLDVIFSSNWKVLFKIPKSLIMIELTFDKTVNDNTPTKTENAYIFGVTYNGRKFGTNDQASITILLQII